MTTLDIQAALERRYRRLLWAYPREYRQRRADEILDTLLELDGGRRWPAPREAVALIVGGVRTRIRANRERPVREMWLSGLRWAVLAMLASALTLPFIYLVVSFPDPAPPAERLLSSGSALLLAAALVLAASGRYRWGIAACAAGWGATAVSLMITGWDGASLAMLTVMPLLAILGMTALAIRRVPGGKWWPWLGLTALYFVTAMLTQNLPTRSLAFALETTMTAVFLLGALVDARIPMISAGQALARLAAQITMLAIMPGELFPQLLPVVGMTAAQLALALCIGPLLHTWRRRSSLPQAPA